MPRLLSANWSDAHLRVRIIDNRQLERGQQPYFFFFFALFFGAAFFLAAFTVTLALLSVALPAGFDGEAFLPPKA